MAGAREAEFRDFVTARQTALLHTATLLAGDRASGEDLLQTALTKTFLAWHRIADRGAVEAYARQVMARTAISWWRRRWRGERPTESLPEIGVADHAERTVTTEVVWQAIRTLPPRQRAVLVLRFHADLTEAQTAQALGVTVGTVKSQTARALRRLRVVLGDDGEHGSELRGELRGGFRGGDADEITDEVTRRPTTERRSNDDNGATVAGGGR